MSKSEEWPVGKAWKMWKSFHERFAPDDVTSEMSMENELMKLKLKKTEDPMNLDDKIAGVAVKYGCIVTDKDRYKTIIRASRNVYSNLISTTEQTYILIQSRKPTDTELLKAMHNSWLLSPSANKTENEDNGGDDSEPTDVALATPGAFANAFNKRSVSNVK